MKALQRPVILGGQLIEPLPEVHAIRKTAAENLARLPGPCHSLFERKDAWRVEVSAELQALYQEVRKGITE